MKTIALLLGLMMLGGCTGLETSQPSADGEASPSFPERSPARPKTREVVLPIEGMTETIAVDLLEAPKAFPLNFSTYMPDDMQVETVSSGEGDALRITAAFGEQPNEQAALTIFAFPARVNAQEARKVVDQTAQALGGTPREDRRYTWSTAEYQLQGEQAGFLALGEHDGISFYLLAAYPPELGDGMAPRIELILREWRWADGQPLEA